MNDYCHNRYLLIILLFLRLILKFRMIIHLLFHLILVIHLIWLNVQTTPFSVLLSEIVVICPSTLLSRTPNDPISTWYTRPCPFAMPNKDNRHFISRLIYKTFTDSSNPNLSTPRPPHRV